MPNEKGHNMETDSEQDPWWVRGERDSANDATFEALCHQQEAIETREDLASFIQALSGDVRLHPTWWQNTSLEGYLYALAAVVESLDQRFKNQGNTVPAQPTWQLVGDVLLAARIYE